MFPSGYTLLRRGEDLGGSLSFILPEYVYRLIEFIALKDVGSKQHPFYTSALLKVFIKLAVEYLLGSLLLSFAVYDFLGGAYVSSLFEALVGIFMFVNTPLIAKRLDLDISNNLTLSLMGFSILVVTFEIFPRDSLVVMSAITFAVLAFIYKGKEGIYWSVEFAVLHVLTIMLSVSYYFPVGSMTKNNMWFEGSVPNIAYVISSAYIIYFLLSGLLFAHYVVIENYKNAYRHFSSTDRLTGLLNRVAFEEAYARELARVKRYNTSLSVIILDIDNFKEINDTYGHNAGDEVLRSVADLVSSFTRETDYVVRWGGEEFLLLCPETTMIEATTIAEKLREAIALYEFPINRRVTASFGVSSFIEGDSQSSLVGRADKALYKAKNSGKNKVCVFNPELATSG